MTIDEAIKSLESLEKYWYRAFFHEHLKALKLGIEALKHIEKSRRFGDLWAKPILPGETED